MWADFGRLLSWIKQFNIFSLCCRLINAITAHCCDLNKWRSQSSTLLSFPRLTRDCASWELVKSEGTAVLKKEMSLQIERWESLHGGGETWRMNLGRRINWWAWLSMLEEQSLQLHKYDCPLAFWALGCKTFLPNLLVPGLQFLIVFHHHLILGLADNKYALLKDLQVQTE